MVADGLRHRRDGRQRLARAPRCNDRAAPPSFSLARTYYAGLAVALVARWIYGVVPDAQITLAFFALATALIGGGGLSRISAFIRAGLVLDIIGTCHYIANTPVFDAHNFTWLDATGFALFVVQPALLRHVGRGVVTEMEGWAVAIVSSAAAWLFVSNSIAAVDDHNLTLGWAVLALALTLIGFAAGERAQRWCGLIILGAAFVRVAVHDFWGFSDVGKVLTFLALTVVCLGLSFLYYKFADRLKEWL